MENWAEIRRLHRSEGISQAGIARTLGISRNTVARALASDRPPKYERVPAGSSVDAVEARVRLLLAEFPTMPATVIAERIGWDRSLTILKDRIRELRPLFVGVDPADRVEYDPGEVAQCDLWFPPVAIPVGGGQHGVQTAGLGGIALPLAVQRQMPLREALQAAAQCGAIGIDMAA